jgi:hypothetical protein
MNNEYNWYIIKSNYNPIHTKLVKKIPMRQIVIDDSNNMFRYEVFNNQLVFTYLKHVYYE